MSGATEHFYKQEKSQYDGLASRLEGVKQAVTTWQMTMTNSQNTPRKKHLNCKNRDDKVDFRKFRISIASNSHRRVPQWSLKQQESRVLIENFSKNKKLLKFIKFRESYSVMKLGVFAKNLKILRFSYLKSRILLQKLSQENLENHQKNHKTT